MVHGPLGQGREQEQRNVQHLPVELCARARCARTHGLAHAPNPHPVQLGRLGELYSRPLRISDAGVPAVLLHPGARDHDQVCDAPRLLRRRGVLRRPGHGGARAVPVHLLQLHHLLLCGLHIRVAGLRADARPRGPAGLADRAGCVGQRHVVVGRQRHSRPRRALWRRHHLAQVQPAAARRARQHGPRSQDAHADGPRAGLRLLDHDGRRDYSVGAVRHDGDRGRLES